MVGKCTMQVKLGEGEASGLLDLTPALLILSLPGVELRCNPVPRKYNNFVVSHISGARCDRQEVTFTLPSESDTRARDSIWYEAGQSHLETTAGR